MPLTVYSQHPSSRKCIAGLNEERRTEKRRKDLEAKQKQTLSSLLKMKILQRGSDRESVLRARWKSLLLRLTSSAQPRQQERERESAGHSNSAQKNKKKLHINPGYHCSTHSAWQNQKAIQSKHGNCGDDKSFAHNMAGEEYLKRV